MNQLVNVAVAETLSALRTEEYPDERAKRGSVSKALRVLKRSSAGGGLPKASSLRSAGAVPVARP